MSNTEFNVGRFLRASINPTQPNEVELEYLDENGNIRPNGYKCVKFPGAAQARFTLRDAYLTAQKTDDPVLQISSFFHELYGVKVTK